MLNIEDIDVDDEHDNEEEQTITNNRIKKIKPSKYLSSKYVECGNTSMAIYMSLIDKLIPSACITGRAI